MRCCGAALPYLRKSPRGRVICIGGSGIGGSAVRQAGATALPSALGNSSIVAFVKQFSSTVAAQGTSANTVHPPFTKTDRYPQRLAAGIGDHGGEHGHRWRFYAGYVLLACQ